MKGIIVSLVIASLLGIFVLFAIMQDYLAYDPLIAADVRIANLFFTFRSLSGVKTFYAITTLASPTVSIAVIGFLAAIFFWRKQWMSGLIGIVGFVGSEGVTALFKIVFHRTRPDLMLRAITEDSYSFPSGHATTAAFLFGYIGYLAFLRFRSTVSRVLIICLVAIGILLIDFSRLYLGVHFVSDVLAGNAIGLLGLFVTIVIDQWRMERRKLIVHPLPATAIGGAVIVLLLAASLVFVSNK